MPVDHFTLTVPKDKLNDMVAFLTSSMGFMGFKEM
jgi:hypothetical protein